MELLSGRVSLGLGLVVELFALGLVPLVLLRRKEPSSTAAWILALVFLPGIGSLLFLMFGRDRVRLPAQWKRAADQHVARRHPHRHRWRLSSVQREAALARVESPVERELFRVGAALSGAEARPGNAVSLLVDGDATYDAIGRAIDAAKHRVDAEYYLVRRDGTAAWFRERLVAAARRGARVRLLLDGYGSFWISRAWLRPLRDAGVEVAFFLPARLLLFQPMNLRNHRKIVVVDGEVGFTGGINVGDEYRGKLGPWRDLHMELRGPAVEPLAEIFEQDWHFATRAPLPAEDKAASLPPPPQPEVGDALVAIVRSGPDVGGVERETIHRLFFSAITMARERVFVTTPYFIPDRAILVALETAAMRGVDIRLLFPSRSNHPVVFQAGRAFYEQLLEAGVRIYEYGPGMIHAKTMVVDGSVALVGSANMDLRSFRLNFEVHAVVRDDATARALEAIFERDLAVTREVELAAFRARPRVMRVLEGVARLLSPLM
ncbi:MAG TPA: cardiolipin synthase [Minicystis sp.]|nr:cardiolipin synthase [Minicystis sp.]